MHQRTKRSTSSQRTPTAASRAVPHGTRGTSAAAPRARWPRSGARTHRRRTQKSACRNYTGAIPREKGLCPWLRVNSLRRPDPTCPPRWGGPGQPSSANVGAVAARLPQPVPTKLVDRRRVVGRLLVLLSAGLFGPARLRGQESRRPTFVVLVDGSREYHAPGCPLVVGNASAKLQSLGDAEARGLAPHAACHSPSAARGAGAKPAPPPKYWLDVKTRRYHRAGCSLIGAPRAQITLALALEKKYLPCRSCKPETALPATTGEAPKAPATTSQKGSAPAAPPTPPR